MDWPAKTKKYPASTDVHFLFHLQNLKKALVLCKEELLKASSTYR